jgi:type VI protein secretion system component Hcp
MRYAHRVVALVLVLGAVLAAAAPAGAAAIYLSIPGIAGENPTPGYPGAMAVSQVTVAPDSFSVVKAIDKASPQIANAVLKGTPLGTASVLFYNAAPSGPPDAILPFADVLASSHTISLSLTETDVFAATTPASIYLEVSGITGEASTPGFTGLMKLDSLDLSGNTFTVDRVTDKATPQIQSAVLLGTAHTAKLLFYNGTPSGPPNVELDFSNVIATSFAPDSSGDVPTEVDAFAFSTLSEPTGGTSGTPEPGSMVLAAMGAALLARRSRRGRVLGAGHW